MSPREQAASSSSRSRRRGLIYDVPERVALETLRPHGRKERPHGHGGLLMPGHGPAPKNPEERRNRHEPQRGEWVDLKPLEERALPELPPPPDMIVKVKGKSPRRVKRDWSPRTVAAWDAWARDPVTALYGPAEIAAVIELAYVMEDMVRGLGMPNEVRLRMDGLGLSPKGKRDLRWRVQQKLEESRPAGRPPASRSKRRARLTVVPG